MFKPTKVMNDAISGDEVALLDITSMLENGTLPVDDSFSIANLDYTLGQKNSQPNPNCYQQYIIGLANLFGSTYFSKNKEKGLAIMADLSEHLSYAQIILAKEIKNSEVLEDLALNKGNALALLYYASDKIKNFNYGLYADDQIQNGVHLGFGLNGPNKPFQEKDIYTYQNNIHSFHCQRDFLNIKKSPSALDSFDLAHKFFPQFATAYATLRKTHYKKLADTIVENFQLDLVRFYTRYTDGKPVLSAAGLNICPTFLSFFGKYSLNCLSKFFEILSNFYKQTGQKTRMFQTLQYAYGIDKRVGSIWERALGVKTYNDALLYLDFIQTSEDEKGFLPLNKIALRQTVELKNAAFLIDQLKDKISENEMETLTSLYNKRCEEFGSSNSIKPRSQSGMALRF